jgi:hypothetical protein
MILSFTCAVKIELRTFSFRRPHGSPWLQNSAFQQLAAANVRQVFEFGTNGIKIAQQVCFSSCRDSAFLMHEEAAKSGRPGSGPDGETLILAFG